MKAYFYMLMNFSIFIFFTMALGSTYGGDEGGHFFGFDLLICERISCWVVQITFKFSWWKNNLYSERTIYS